MGKRLGRWAIWIVVALVGAICWGVLAFFFAFALPLDKDPAVRRHFPQGWRDFDYVVST